MAGIAVAAGFLSLLLGPLIVETWWEGTKS
jgi:hypothetical protein